ncbi:MAG: CRTAC1 family protein, partial [Acidimicrobiales bacterium]
LMANDGHGRFTDVTEEAGVPGPDQESGYATALWADIEGDGDLDLLLTGAGRTANVLYVNRGDGTFRDEARGRGLQDLPVIKGYLGNAGYGATFFDWDHDGDLDLVVAQWYTNVLFDQPDLTSRPRGIKSVCEMVANVKPSAPGDPIDSRTRLYTNDGTGHFEDVTASSGVDVDTVIAFQPRFADVDGDGWEDLLMTGDVCTSRLFRNVDGKRFEDVTEESGLGTDENGMGSVVEDIDGDGNIDWFVTAIRVPTEDDSCPVQAPTFACSGNRLYLGDGKGSFTDATDEYGVRDGSWGWGATGEDLDDDGHRDLFMVNGYRPVIDNPGLEIRDPDAAMRARFDDDRSRFWKGQDTTPWPQGAASIGITDRANGKAVVAFDADGDGDLDLIIANTEDAPILYRNDTPAKGRHRLTLRLRDPDGTNPFAIGAQVRIRFGDGRSQLSLVRADGSFQSGNPTDVHVGLGASDHADRIDVTWPGGGDPQVLTDVEADQVLTIEREPAS